CGLSPCAHEASLPISPAPQCVPRGQLARALGTFGPVFPQARGLRPAYSSCCTWLSHAPTTMPHPTFPVASGFRWGLPCLLSTSLHIHQEISRVQPGQLKQNDVGGVFLLVPSALCGSPVFPWGKTSLPMSPRPTAYPGQLWSLLSRVSH